MTSQTKALIDSPLLIGDIIEVEDEETSERKRGGRLTAHFRAEEVLIYEKQFSCKSLRKVLIKHFEAEQSERKSLGLPSTRKLNLFFCKPEEATHLEMTALAGDIARTSQCHCVGVVNWSEELLKEEQEDGLFMALNNDGPVCSIWE